MEPQPGPAAAAEPGPAPGPRPEPAPAARPAPRPDPEPQPAPAPKPDPDIPSAGVLAGYPSDFMAEVHCPTALMAGLTVLLPMGAMAMQQLAEDWDRAGELGLIRGQRRRATFPLRIEHPDSTDPILVTLRKQEGAGMPWAVLRIE